MDLKTLSRNAGMAVQRLLFDPEQVSKLDLPEFNLSLAVASIQRGLSSLHPFSFPWRHVWAGGKRLEGAAIEHGRFES